MAYRQNESQPDQTTGFLLGELGDTPHHLILPLDINNFFEKILMNIKYLHDSIVGRGTNRKKQQDPQQQQIFYLFINVRYIITKN